MRCRLTRKVPTSGDIGNLSRHTPASVWLAASNPLCLLFGGFQGRLLLRASSSQHIRHGVIPFVTGVFIDLAFGYPKAVLLLCMLS